MQDINDFLIRDSASSRGTGSANSSMNNMGRLLQQDTNDSLGSISSPTAAAVAAQAAAGVEPKVGGKKRRTRGQGTRYVAKNGIQVVEHE